ncbi:probable membrane-associated kinase regulator 4 [Miscanthus floridulus]|uniref:probable membrane-associated kinase regulator 4 n=1 Tax=Miscanthus floridulus TaxID=154761 RepID=UPI00345B2521
MAGRREEGDGQVQRRQQEGEEEEDYIDMDLSSVAAAGAREFEFMSAPLDRWGEPLASPADELFYKGKLLPLHLPPRIQMVEELLDGRGAGSREFLHRGISTAPATPYESCNASPANSCYVSGELNVEEYFQEYAAAAGLALAADAAAAPGGERKPWSRKLRFMRQLNLGLRLKASKAYLKTIFAAKPDEKNDLGAATARGAREELAHGHAHGHPRAWRKNPFAQIRSNRCIASDVCVGGGSSRAAPAAGRYKEREHGHRRSFSSVIVRYSSSNKTSPVPALPLPSSSSSSSSSSSASSSVRTSTESDGAGPALRRSSSASSEVENPIQGLIAYCKKSQQLASVRKSASDAGFRFLSSAASKIAAESDDLDELTEICRG